jgi:predicted DsbA family dithiol-disulfide isomerase
MRPGPNGSVSSDGEWNVLVEIWSDVVCPWCYVGKRHFEEALSRFPQRDEVSVVWRSFELDPTAPTRSDQSMSEVLQRKYGMTEDQAEEANAKMTALAAGVGLEYHLDRVQRSNTLDAHRLLHLAATHGLADATEERLLSAYFTEGAAIGDRPTLVRLAVEVGLDGEEVERMLDGDEFTAEVRSD